MGRVFIIAEAGVNHGGNPAKARRMVEVAAAVGADAIKFQTFRAEELVSRNAPKAEYQRRTTDAGESQLEMIRKLELGRGHFRELAALCRRTGIVFLSTPFDRESVDFLVSLGMDILKVPSGEITNLPYLRKVGSMGKRLIVSTGMADLDEVRAAISVLRHAGARRDQITLLHCNTEYPTPFGDVNIRAMITLRDEFGLQVGYSDHTLGIEVPVAAVAMGAEVIEKHFTLDRSMPGPDQRASLSPASLRAMVRSIRRIEDALGDGVKRSSPSEAKNIAVARRSIVAACNIRQGEVFSESNLAAKRPGTGLSPMQWDKVIGRRAKRSFHADERIEI